MKRPIVEYAPLFTASATPKPSKNRAIKKYKAKNAVRSVTVKMKLKAIALFNIQSPIATFGIRYLKMRLLHPKHTELRNRYRGVQARR